MAEPVALKIIMIHHMVVEILPAEVCASANYSANGNNSMVGRFLFEES